MKRFITLLLSIILLICCSACDSSKNELSFEAEIIDIIGDCVFVEPAEGQNMSDEKIIFSKAELEDIGAEIGSFVRVYYNGVIEESYPAKIHADKWELVKHAPIEQRSDYAGEWLDKETAESVEAVSDGIDLKITEIYADCFLASSIIPSPYTYKINYKLNSMWCVGDKVTVTYENAYCDSITQRMEVDGISVAESDFEPDPFMAYKPVIYLYPEAEIEVSVVLNLNGEFTCTYPEYDGGWCVTASPDGTLTADGMQYNYLYWEGEIFGNWDMSRGFCVKGEDTADFLETALAKLGLNRRESNEFIVYWLPLMQNNPYNIISFQSELYAEAARLDITPAPETLIRVFMTYTPSDEYTQIVPQDLTAIERVGFTAVEWGGAVVK